MPRLPACSATPLAGRELGGAVRVHRRRREWQAALRDALVADTPSPITYASEKPADVLAEDAVIQAFPLDIDADDVRVVPVGDVFEGDVFGR